MPDPRAEHFGTYEHCGPDGSCFRPKGHEGGCVPRPQLPEGLFIATGLRGPVTIPAMSSGFKENAEDLNTADSVQVGVNPPMTAAELAEIEAALARHQSDQAGAFRLYNADVIRRLLDENARLNTELAARDTRIEALSEALAAKNRELDKVIQGSLDAGAEWASKMEAVRARIADLEELKCSVCGMRVAHLNCNGHVIGWGCADGEECKAAPEMPRPPAEEAAWSDADRVCAFDGCGESCRHDEENPVPPAQKPVSGPETAGTGSGRGTGVAEAPGTAHGFGEEA